MTKVTVVKNKGETRGNGGRPRYGKRAGMSPDVQARVMMAAVGVADQSPFLSRAIYILHSESIGDTRKMPCPSPVEKRRMVRAFD